jgi:hypothetical protein
VSSAFTCAKAQTATTANIVARVIRSKFVIMDIGIGELSEKAPGKRCEKRSDPHQEHRRQRACCEIRIFPTSAAAMPIRRDGR